MRQEKIPVGILGATGSVGQKLIHLLEGHPWFEIAVLMASEKSIGKRYKEAVNWLMPVPLPSKIGNMSLQACQPNIACSIVFSALDASVAGEIETAFAQAGYIVISNSMNHRLDPHVPLVVPEVNPEHMQLLEQQPFSKGKIVTNPNCAVIGLTMALKPLQERFGIEEVHVVTLQAISGAGYPGVASLDILDNVIPFIQNEEEKIEIEPKKILGTFREGQIINADFSISAQCNRVPVTDGHMECVSVRFKSKATKEDIIQAWQDFSGKPQMLKFPTAPVRPLHYFEETVFPQPKRHHHLNKGMTVSLGRLRPCSIFDYKFVLLSHNTVRGAAGCALLNAELTLATAYINRE
jgi:aspartate-semialdehyde dehydrogenase